MQLQPIYLLLSCKRERERERERVLYLFSAGQKRISLNEKKRGFPTGLRVMSSSEANATCLLEVDSALEMARFRGVSMTIVKVEVWGCGGERAMERQQKMKEWEKQLILKRRKVTKVFPRK